MKDYDVLNELVPKTQELHRAIFDKGYEQGQKDLPFVALEEKTGKWIRTTDKTGHLVWECDCGWSQKLWTNFCPDCGARMVEPQESEDKE